MNITACSDGHNILICWRYDHILHIIFITDMVCQYIDIPKVRSSLSKLFYNGFLEANCIWAIKYETTSGGTDVNLITYRLSGDSNTSTTFP